MYHVEGNDRLSDDVVKKTVGKAAISMKVASMSRKKLIRELNKR